MRNVQANIHFDEGDRLQVQELEGCAGVVVLRCGTASGITMFFEDQEEAARVLLHALAQLHAIAAARLAEAELDAS